MRGPSAWRRLAAATAAVCLLQPAPSVAARPLTVEDVLQAETIADTAIDPTERWAVIEHARPYASAARFDFDLLQPMLTTELLVVDLDRPGQATPLFPHEAGVGYAAGPFAPDGRHIAVHRLTSDSFTLGVADLAARTVRWLEVTPEISWEGRALAWTSPTQLLLLTPAPGELPMYVRSQRPWRELPARWETTALGRAVPGVWKGGRTQADRQRTAPGRLLRLDISTGRTAVLAIGRFIDLEVSPSGRHAALLEAGEDVRLKAGQPVHGDMGVATVRKRLRLVATGDGRVSTPCPACDHLQGLLAWAPDRDRLLGFARQDGDPWRDGRLLDIDAATGRQRDLSPAVRPAIAGRPEIVAAAWLDGAPIVYGRASDASTARNDWWRLSGPLPVNLTRMLPDPPMTGVLARPGALVLATRSGGWSVDPQGRAHRLEVAPLEPLPLWSRALTSRGKAAAGRGALPVRRRDALGAGLLDLGADGATALPMPDGADLYAYAPRRRGAFIRTLSGGGRQDLAWIVPGRPATPILTANARLAEIDVPRTLPIRHVGPDGRALTSWLLLPALPPGAPPPPLVVFPYVRWTYARTPDARLTGTFRDRFEILPLVGHGYAVLLPSLPEPTDGRGPAEGLADRILAIVDTAAKDPAAAGAFDPDRLGVVGLSFGAHNALAVITQTGRFRAAVATHGPSSLISKWGEFGIAGRTFPEGEIPSAWSIGWTETVQGLMRAPPWADPARYVANSPLMHADRITTPLLMVQGEFDSMSPAEAERMFSALYRQDKDVEMVVYPGEGHVFGSPGVIRDYYARLFAWLDAHLMPSGGPTPRSPPR